MSTPIPMGGFPGVFRPYSNIQPFTYRDGSSYLEILEGIRYWVSHTIVPHVNKEVEELVQAWTVNIETVAKKLDDTLDAVKLDNIETFDEIVAENVRTLASVTTKITTALSTVDTKTAESRAYVDAAVASIINATIAVTDPAVEFMVASNSTKTGKALIQLYGAPAIQNSASPVGIALRSVIAAAVPPVVASAIGSDTTIVNAAASAVSAYLTQKGMQDPRIERVADDAVFSVQIDGAPAPFFQARPEPIGSEFVFRLTSPDGSTFWGIRKNGSVYPASFGGATPGGSSINLDAISKAETSGPRIARIGDSMSAQWAQPYITSALNVPGISEVSNISAGGEASYNIAARVGAVPAKLLPVGGSIPASGSVDVSVFFGDKIVPQGEGVFNKWMFLQGATSVTGTLAGISGIWSIIRAANATQYVHHPDDRYIFTRGAAGAVTAVPYPEQFIVSQTDEYRASVPVINLGTNNLNSDDMDQLENDLKAIVQYFRGSHKRFIIWSSFGVRPSEASTPTGLRIIEARRRAARIGGAYFVDVVAWMSKYGLAYAGITPTAQDVTDMADGIVPVSLSASNADRHYNQTGYGIVGMLVAKRMKDLGWYSATKWINDPIGEKA